MPVSELNSLLDRMDSIHDDHQNQMIQKWQSMSFEKQVEMIAKMSEKIIKMESMNMSQHISAMDNLMQKDGKHYDKKMMKTQSEPIYNETLNPRQIDYPNTLGFSDLHIHAIRHLDVNVSRYCGSSAADYSSSSLQGIR